MPNMTLSIPEDLHKKMRKHSEIRWSEVARKSIAEKIEDLETINNIAGRSRLTQTDADEIALARQFGVAYQHTKVFVRSGKKILKSPEGWDDKRYDIEINKALTQ